MSAAPTDPTSEDQPADASPKKGRSSVTKLADALGSKRKENVDSLVGKHEVTYQPLAEPVKAAGSMVTEFTEGGTGQPADVNPSKSTRSSRLSLGKRTEKVNVLVGELEVKYDLPTEEEDEWKVGGRYTIRRFGVPIFANDECTREIGQLKRLDQILLLSIKYPEEEPAGGVPIGLVVPPAGMVPGWVVLEDPPEKSNGSGTGPVVRACGDGSWEMKGRYTVVNAATVRQHPLITSFATGELEVGMEVFILELGLNPGEVAHDVRLRARVSTVDGSLIGWMSPETPGGDRLLDPVNLSGPKVVEIHRKSLLSMEASDSGSPKAAKKSFLGCLPQPRERSNSRSRGSSDAGDSLLGSQPKPRSSFRAGSMVPWHAGGQYRVLETLPLMMHDVKVADLPPATLVTVQEVRVDEAMHNVPSALIVVDDGNFAGKQGWVLCTHVQDHHDMLDVRDQKDYERVVLKLRTQGSIELEPEQPVTGKGSNVEPKKSATGLNVAEQPKSDVAESSGKAPGCMAGCLRSMGSPCSPKSK